MGCRGGSELGTGGGFPYQSVEKFAICAYRRKVVRLMLRHIAEFRLIFMLATHPNRRSPEAGGSSLRRPGTEASVPSHEEPEAISTWLGYGNPIGFDEVPCAPPRTRVEWVLHVHERVSVVNWGFAPSTTPYAVCRGTVGEHRAQPWSVGLGLRPRTQ